MTPCPDADRLRRLLADELDADDQRQLQAHLETCPACQQLLERLAARGPSWDRAALHLGGPEEATDPALAQAVDELEATELNLGTPTGTETEGEAPPTSGVELPFLDPPAEPGHLGRMGHYEILGIVGRGGMGVVLKALDERLHRVVAVKVLGPQFATSGSARARFAREAKAAAAVSHDHVVPIYHVDEHRGIPFLVMPLIAGKSLQDRIEQDGPLELKEILRIGSQTACGLAAAHKQGLVHRDIKPANILLENGVERVKITDFGLARAVDDASVTQSGVIAGTPMFMSPEQARGEFSVDARSDLFSLGSVLYMMATGRPPFRASGTHAVLRRVIEETPRPLRDVNVDIPDWLEAIVAKLHAKRPEDRFQSAQEIADLLGQHLAHLQQPRRVEMPAPVEAPPTAVPGRQAAVPRAAGSVWVKVALVVGSLFLAGGCVVVSILFGGAAVGMLGAVFLLRGPEADPHVMHEAPAPVAVGVPFEKFKPADKNEKWHALFNGKDLAGWNVLPKGREDWHVDKLGNLVIDGPEAPSYLFTKRDDFVNFHLRADVKASARSDAGILFRWSPDLLNDKLPVAYEVKIGAGEFDKQSFKTGTLVLSPPGIGALILKKVDPTPAPDNAWFKMEVVARGMHIVVKIDDQTVVDDRIPRPTAAKGRIGLRAQSAQTHVQIRKLEVRELPPEGPFKNGPFKDAPFIDRPPEARPQ